MIDSIASHIPAITGFGQDTASFHCIICFFKEPVTCQLLMFKISYAIQWKFIQDSRMSDRVYRLERTFKIAWKLTYYYPPPIIFNSSGIKQQISFIALCYKTKLIIEHERHLLLSRWVISFLCMKLSKYFDCIEIWKNWYCSRKAKLLISHIMLHSN